MADTFSDIMKNYKDMSVTELGTSLLQQKEKREKQDRRSAKKDRQFQQALGLLLAGQSIFKGAYKKRADELEKAHTFELANIAEQFQDIRNLSAITSPIYQWKQAFQDGNIDIQNMENGLYKQIQLAPPVFQIM